MIKKLAIVLLMFLMISCSVTSSLSRKYEGKGLEALYKDMGYPKSVSELSNGNKLYKFEKTTYVKETEISTGRGTLDPRISPSYSKVEIFLFEINKEGVIVKTDYQKRIDK
jgi:hypothetical protein